MDFGIILSVDNWGDFDITIQIQPTMPSLNGMKSPKTHAYAGARREF